MATQRSPKPQLGVRLLGPLPVVAPAAERPNPLIYKAEKDWKKDGLNPVFPLAGLMLLIRSRPVWPRGCVCVCVRAPVRVGVRVVVSCAPECTRGGLEGRLSVIV